MVVYLITCVPNSRRYVGSTNNLKARWQDHKSFLKRKAHHNVHMQRACNKYGLDAFKIETLWSSDSASVDELIRMEADFIKKLLPEFNIQRDPVKSPMCEPAIQAKQFKSWMSNRKKESEAKRSARIAAFKASVSRPEVQSRIAEANRKRARDPKYVAIAVAAMNTPSARAKSSAKLRGKRLSKSHRQKIRLAMKKWRPTAEQRLAMSEHAKRVNAARWASTTPEQRAAFGKKISAAKRRSTVDILV